MVPRRPWTARSARWRANCRVSTTRCCECTASGRRTRQARPARAGRQAIRSPSSCRTCRAHQFRLLVGRVMWPRRAAPARGARAPRVPTQTARASASLLSGGRAPPAKAIDGRCRRAPARHRRSQPGPPSPTRQAGLSAHITSCEPRPRRRQTRCSPVAQAGSALRSGRRRCQSGSTAQTGGCETSWDRSRASCSHGAPFRARARRPGPRPQRRRRARRHRHGGHR